MLAQSVQTAPAVRSIAPAATSSGIRWTRTAWRPLGLQTDDDDGCVVGGVAQGDECFSEVLGVVFAVACEEVGEALKTLVDVFPTALDQSVGVENEGGTFRVGDGGLRTRGVIEARPQWGSVAWSRKRTVPSGLTRTAGGWPALL